MSMVSRRQTIIIRSAIVMLLLLCIGAGIAREEVWDVISNATLLCFSCIGIK